MSEIPKNEFFLFFFLSPQCPLSENYSKTINEINEEIDSDSAPIQVYVIIPGRRYSRSEIESFATTFHIQPDMLLDPQLELTKFLHATITPETFLLNSDQQIIYSGAIDNWAVDLGQKRQVITEYYLKDAIDSILQHKEVVIKNTTAVGCFIEGMNDE